MQKQNKSGEGSDPNQPKLLMIIFNLIIIWGQQKGLKYHFFSALFFS